MLRSILCRWRRSANAIVLILLCAACEGDSSSSSGNPVGGSDGEAPLAAIQFPPDDCLTDAAQVTLTMAVSDETGIAVVRVAGSRAVLGSDSLWRVSVPLNAGINTIRVETRDTLDNLATSAAQLTIRRESALWIEPSSLTFDLAAGDALVLDPLLRTVFRVRPTGARSVVTGPGVGGGALLASPRDLDLVASLDAVVVTDGELDAVVLVDLATGAQTLLSSPSLGGGPTPLDLQGIAVDLLRNRALVVDEARAELLAVDLATGQRSTLSSDTVGSGVSLSTPRRIALDPARNRALVTLESTRVILAVDLGTGNRTVLSGGTTGSGPAFVTPFDMAVDIFQDRAFVTDLGARGVFEVDLASGDRQVFSSHSVGNGPDWLTPAAVAVRLDGVPLVLDSSMDALVEVAFGDRRIVSGITSGSGPPIVRPIALASSLLLPERLAVAEPTELFTADAWNGARELISGTERGTGAPFLRVSAAALSRGPRACLTVLDAGLPGLVGVDLLTGSRRTISGGGTGFGPGFSRLSCMVLEPSVVECSSAAVVVDMPLGAPAAILRVDLSTGSRSIVSDATHGSGPDMVDPVAIEIDLGPLDAFAIVLDAELQALFSVDLFSGDRVLSFLPELPGTPTDLALDGERFLVTVTDPPALLLVTDQLATVLSGATVGAGPALGRPVALELVPSATVGSIPRTPIAYVLDAARASVLAVDTKTGDRVIRAK